MGLLAGAAYVGAGLGMWRRRPRLMLLGIVPALLVLLAVLAALVGLLVNLGDLVAWATPFADGWAEVLRGLLRLGLALLVLHRVEGVALRLTQQTVEDSRHAARPDSDSTARHACCCCCRLY